MNTHAIRCESEWRHEHEHLVKSAHDGKYEGPNGIIVESYTGTQPPTYTLEQLRCLRCDAVLIRIQKATRTLDGVVAQGG